MLRDLNRELEQARIGIGLIPLRGKGIVLQLEDAPQAPPGTPGDDHLVTARDVRTLIEELWLAGAEAIAINGERVTLSTAVIDIGASILVNSAYLAPPYQVAAIGPDGLWQRVSELEGFIDFMRARSQGYGIRVSFAELDEVDVPAFAGSITLRHARILPPDPSPRP
jgi:uncharacterized protein YlxW (UPF0749 family)